MRNKRKREEMQRSEAARNMTAEQWGASIEIDPDVMERFLDFFTRLAELEAKK